MATIVCPDGHRFRPPAVVYGLPDARLMQDAEAGSVVVGGCVPGEPVEIPCPTCGLTTLWWSEQVSGGRRTPRSEASDRPI